jgi:hypothetical protein
LDRYTILRGYGIISDDYPNVVIVPDRDKPGMNHALAIAQDFPDAEWLYPFPDSPVWDNLPTKAGLDIADWITDYRLSADEVLTAIALDHPLCKNLQIIATNYTPKGIRKRDACGGVIRSGLSIGLKQPVTPCSMNGIIGVSGYGWNWGFNRGNTCSQNVYTCRQSGDVLHLEQSRER